RIENRNMTCPYRFKATAVSLDGEVTGYNVYDCTLDLTTFLPRAFVRKEGFDLRNWYMKRVIREGRAVRNLCLNPWTNGSNLYLESLEENWGGEDDDFGRSVGRMLEAFAQRQEAWDTMEREGLELFAIPGRKEAPSGRRHIERNASRPKDPSRMIPDPVVVTVKLNGKPVRALVDSGSLGDFVSTTVVGQLGLKKEELKSPLSVLLAAQGSRSKINYGVSAKFEYAGILEDRHFDVMNLSGYDMIL
ncbi:hypothetical protein H0H93_016960, partial [Arthromyces matolae]